ncbi:hypothetical protein BC831DRAFT_181491 [Entophlyctis helioformis]|nr:hypothetical protein BC831DRAFT_181491 [Entophlyctis helioformis]
MATIPRMSRTMGTRSKSLCLIVLWRTSMSVWWMGRATSRYGASGCARAMRTGRFRRDDSVLLSRWLCRSRRRLTITGLWVAAVGASRATRSTRCLPCRMDGVVQVIRMMSITTRMGSAAIGRPYGCRVPLRRFRLAASVQQASLERAQETPVLGCADDC